jgi:hypothetical protein
MGFLKYITMIPLFSVLLIIYLILAASGVNFGHAEGLFSMPLLSDATFSPTAGDLVVIIGVITLYVEIFKSTRTSSAGVIEHVLSMFTFIVYLVLFLAWGKAGTSTFLILGLMSLLDVVAGFTISIATARRDLNVVGSNN